MHYEYDGQVVQRLSGAYPPGFDPLYDPYTNPDGLDLPRSNVTKITRYPNPTDDSSALVETRNYDITGNLVEVLGSDCCQRLATTYSEATAYALPETVSRGSASLPLAARSSVSTRRYDVSSGLVCSVADDDGRKTVFIG